MANSADSGAVWMAEFLSGATRATGSEPTSGPDEGVIVGPLGVAYRLRKDGVIAANSRYNLYPCRVGDEGRPGLLKVAASAAQNGLIETEALILKMIAERAAELDAGRSPGEKPYNYQNFFPALLECFTPSGQGDRKVSVVGFAPSIKGVSEYSSIWHKLEKERHWVDPRTGAWILGKSLKILDFAHRLGVANRLLDPSNILFTPSQEKHGVMILDWTAAEIYANGFAPEAVAREEVQTIAYQCVRLMNGDPTTGKLPPNDQLVDGRYEELLRMLVSGAYADAGEAYEAFYGLIRPFWSQPTWPPFHPYTEHPM